MSIIRVLLIFMTLVIFTTSTIFNQFITIVGKYNASKHTCVINGTQTITEMAKQLIKEFDTGVVDGKISYDEFENYYTFLSLGI